MAGAAIFPHPQRMQRPKSLAKIGLIEKQLRSWTTTASNNYQLQNLRLKILENYGTRVKGTEKLKLEPCTQSSHSECDFMVILLKIAKRKSKTFTPNQEFK